VKRPSGHGSVSELGPARFWARSPRLPDGSRPSLGVYPTFGEADAVRAAAVNQIAAADLSELPGTTLRAFGERVLSDRARELPRSAPAEGTRWRRILRAPFIDERVESLTSPAVDRWARQLLRDLPGSARCTLTLLSAICGQAIREGRLAVNPCVGIRLRRPPRTHEPWTYLLPAEQRALVAAPLPERVLLWILCLLGTAVRVGELLALRLADVHLDDADPHIVIRYGSPHGPTKGNLIRSVPLFGVGLRALRRWLELLPAWCSDNRHGLAFPAERGGFLLAKSFLVRQKRVGGKHIFVNDFHDAIAAAGIVAERRHDGRPVRVHDIRHTSLVSLLCGWWGDEPWRIEDISAFAGHESIATTVKYYAHIDRSRLRALADRTPGLPLGDSSAPPIALPTAKRALLSPVEAGADGAR
jgi:integrase